MGDQEYHPKEILKHNHNKSKIIYKEYNDNQNNGSKIMEVNEHKMRIIETYNYYLINLKTPSYYGFLN